MKNVKAYKKNEEDLLYSVFYEERDQTFSVIDKFFIAIHIENPINTVGEIVRNIITNQMDYNINKPPKIFFYMKSSE
jgi:hypothetical protein